MPKLGRRAEMQEYDFYNVNSNFTTMVAPFGTNHTPPISYKIVAGHYVPVVERLSHNDPLNGHPKIHHLEPITDKPNNIDPRILTDRSKQYYTTKQENYSSHIQGKATFEARNRPDSKSFIPRERLPPINANRQKNEMSTVFENETWVKNRNPPLQSDTEYKKHYNFQDQYNRNGIDNNNDYRQSDRSRMKYPPSVDNVEEFEAYLQSNKILPDDPVRYPPHLEERLMGMTARMLESLTPGKSLKDVYLTIAESVDRDLSGYVRLSDVENAFVKYNVYLSKEVLRCLGAQFVSRSWPDSVNYEKLLSFMGTAINMSSNNSNNVQNGRPQYYSQPKSPRSPTLSLKDSSPFHDREMAKLISMTQKQLKENDFHIDMEALFAAFQAEDREHRDTLSADQILQIMYKLRIPLQSSLIRSILLKCEHVSQWPDDHAPNVHQYNWMRFYEFLTKVQPVHTGLPIPLSKRPLEYAKTYPQPMDTWPKAKESPRMSPPMWKKENGYGLSSPRKRDDYEPQQSNRSYQNPGVKNDKPVWEKIQHVDHELKQLEETNKMLREGIIDPWNNRFIKLANKLFLKDEQRKCDGTLPFKDVVEITNFCNRQYHLHIPEETIVRRARDCFTTNQNVDLAAFLSKIGNMEW